MSLLALLFLMTRPSFCVGSRSIDAILPVSVASARLPLLPWPSPERRVCTFLGCCRRVSRHQPSPGFSCCPCSRLYPSGYRPLGTTSAPAIAPRCWISS
jgi:hypothetical protein